MTSLKRRGGDIAAIMAIAVMALATPAYAAESPPTAEQGAVADSSYLPTVLVTGSDKGLGLEFVRQYAARGARVIATTRNPADAAELKALAVANPQVIIEKLDVTDNAAIDALAAKYAETPIDVLINNAGISGGMQSQAFGKLDYEVFMDVLRVNTIAPLKMSEAFLPSIIASHDKRIVAVSSTEGSISMVKAARLYFMRASKAALNMEMRNLAFQLKSKGVAVGLVNPGLVDTDFVKGLPKSMLRPPSEAVRDLLRNIDGMTVENSGSFWNYDGTLLPW